MLKLINQCVRMFSKHPFARMKKLCFTIVDMLITKMERHFVDFKLMNAFSIVYPQVWMESNVVFSFSLHFDVIKKHYCESKKVRPPLDQIVEAFNVNLLNLQWSIFKLTTKTKAPKATANFFDTDLMKKSWMTINNNGLLI